MKFKIVFIIIIGIQSISAQIGNTKAIIAKNKVKESFEKHCFLRSNSSCSFIWEKYDLKGNSIEWNMGRLAGFRKNIYDKNDNKLFTIWVDKMDSTKTDSLKYVYDKYNQIIQEGEDKYKNTYDIKNQLVKQINESKNNENNIVRKTKTIEWTSFGKVRTEVIKTEIIESAQQTKYDKVKFSCKEFEFDNNCNLAKEIHYQDETVTNTIIYNYDTSGRLIEKREQNIARLKSVNRRKFKNREDISEFITRVQYNPNGSIKEKYTYFSDPCMSLNNHYLYKHFYLENGLLEHADVYEGDRLLFSINYEYEYYK